MPFEMSHKVEVTWNRILRRVGSARLTLQYVISRYEGEAHLKVSYRVDDTTCVDLHLYVGDGWYRIRGVNPRVDGTQYPVLKRYGRCANNPSCNPTAVLDYVASVVLKKDSLAQRKEQFRKRLAAFFTSQQFQMTDYSYSPDHLIRGDVDARVFVTLNPSDPNVDKKIALLRLLFSLDKT